MESARTRPLPSARGTISAEDGTGHASSQAQAVERSARSLKPDRRTSRAAFESGIAKTIPRSFHTGWLRENLSGAIQRGAAFDVKQGRAFAQGNRVRGL